MGKVAIGDVADGRTDQLPDVEGRSTTGEARMAGIFVDADRPLLLWTCTLETAATLAYERPPVGHVLYVAAGSARVGDKVLGPGGVAVVERGGALSVQASEGPVTLLDFHGSAPSENDRPGGHVHVQPMPPPQKENPASGMRLAMFADSTCPTCSLWMHHTEFPGGAHAPPHLHTEDEVIVVVGGELRLGTRSLGPGAALAIDRDTVYSFTAGDDGLAFVNFRTGDSSVILITKEGRSPLRLERDITYPPIPPGRSTWNVPSPSIAFHG
jgi:redox-sensitive bicupin YhaK (pirin superfamily)